MKKPNILIFFTDQQSCWSISTLGATDIHTPNIDRIGDEGAVFENFYTPTAVCTPSRGSFLTGLYSFQHKAVRNNEVLSTDATTFAEILRDSGYKTGYAGKWHLNGDAKPGWIKPDESRGFDDCQFMFNRGHWKKIEVIDGEPQVSAYSDSFNQKHDNDTIGDEKTYTTDFLCDRAIEFINDTVDDQPFLYMVNIPDPHTPFCVREPYASMYDPEKLSLPEAYYKSCPPWPKGGKVASDSELSDPDNARKLMAAYLGEVKCIDDNVGKVLRTLEEKNILDDTIIVFTTDHGEYMGEHGLWGKNHTYSSVFHIPFLMRYPKKIDKGTRLDNYVSAVDFKRLLLDVADVADPVEDESCEVSALLTNPDTAWENRVFLYNMSMAGIAIRRGDYFLSLRNDGYHMLFDMVNDPHQCNNIIDKEEHKAIVTTLADELIEFHKSNNTPAMKWLPGAKIL